jgi:trigger factor
MKKKAVTLLLAMAMVMTSAAGCGKKAENKSTKKTEQAAAVTYHAADYVKLGDYKNLSITLDNDYTADDKAVKQYMQKLIEQASDQSFEKDKSQKTVKKDSIVNVDYKGIKDGKAFEGGTAKDQTIDVAGNKEASGSTGYIDGFTDGLVGAKVGDTVSSEVTFPENYSSKELAGQRVTFEFKVNYICKKVTLANVDKDFLNDNFNVKTLEEFKDYAKKRLEGENASNKASEIRSKVIAKLTEISKVEAYPSGLIDERMEDYQSQFEARNLAKGQSLEAYLKNTYNVTLEDFKKEIRKQVKENVKTELIFTAIADAEGIKVDQDGFDKYVSNLMMQYSLKTKAQLYKFHGRTQELGKAYIRTIYLCNKAVDACVDKAKVVTK